MACKGAIFDMDGILFDTEKVYQETWRELAQERGIDLGDTFTKTITGTSGKHMQDIIEQYYQTADGLPIIEECMKRVRQKLDVHVPVKKGVPEILEYFRGQGVKMAVASSSFKNQIQANLTKSGLAEYFDEVISGTELKRGKPAPDIFIHAAECLGYAPDECYVFEDSANGIRAGHAAGCVTIMIPDLIEPTEEIVSLCAKVCRDFFEVKDDIISGQPERTNE